MATIRCSKLERNFTGNVPVFLLKTVFQSGRFHWALRGLLRKDWKTKLLYFNNLKRFTSIAIGRAPKVGRPRWLALVEAIEDPAALVAAIVAATDPAILRWGSDAKFSRVLQVITGSGGSVSKRVWNSLDGRASAAIAMSSKSVSIVLSKKDSGFGEYVFESLGDLHDNYTNRKNDGDD